MGYGDAVEKIWTTNYSVSAMDINLWESERAAQKNKNNVSPKKVDYKKQKKLIETCNFIPKIIPSTL